MKHKTHTTQILRHTKLCDTGALQKARWCLTRADYLGFSLALMNQSYFLQSHLGTSSFFCRERKLKCFCIEDTQLMHSQDN